MRPTLILALAAVCSITCGTVLAASIKAISADDAQQGNPAVHAFDSDAGTKWAAPGKGRWIQCELNEAITLSKIGIGFEASERDYAFDVRTSSDGKTWGAPARFQSKGKGGTVSYELPEAKIRFVRVTVHGSNKNDWANIHTIEVPGIEPIVESNGNSAAGGYEVSEWASGDDIANNNS